jgi:hypothetical protein
MGIEIQDISIERQGGELKRIGFESLKKRTASSARTNQGMLEMTQNYFSDLFTADQNVAPDEIVNLFEQKISADMNQNLCRYFSEEEISDALFQIGPLKAPGPDSFPARFFFSGIGTL